MSKKEELIDKLCQKPAPSNFSVRELDQLMAKCDCKKRDGGRGSSISSTEDAWKFNESRIPKTSPVKSISSLSNSILA